MVKPFFYCSFWAANAPLCCNGDQGISQLCQSHPQQIQFLHRSIAGDGIGKSGNRCSQFAGVHRFITPAPSYAAVSYIATRRSIFPCQIPSVMVS